MNGNQGLGIEMALKASGGEKLSDHSATCYRHCGPQPGEPHSSRDVRTEVGGKLEEDTQEHKPKWAGKK